MKFDAFSGGLVKTLRMAEQKYVHRSREKMAAALHLVGFCDTSNSIADHLQKVFPKETLF